MKKKNTVTKERFNEWCEGIFKEEHPPPEKMTVWMGEKALKEHQARLGIKGLFQFLNTIHLRTNNAGLRYLKKLRKQLLNLTIEELDKL